MYKCTFIEFLTVSNTAAGVPMTHRQAFTDKETDLESNQADHGARKLDKRLGRFTSGDALWKKYRGLSPYVYVANNPLLFTDWSGDSLDYEDAASKTLFDEIYVASSTTVQARYDELRASDVMYYININASLPAGVNGNTTYNSIEKRIDIMVNSSTVNKVGALGDELTHAYQFEHGEIGYVPGRTLGFDMEDEIASKRAEIEATKEYNLEYGTSISLSTSVAAFEAADAAGPAAIVRYFASDPSATNYEFQPPTPAFPLGGGVLGVSIPGHAGYTIPQLEHSYLSGGILGYAVRISGVTYARP